MANDPAFLFYPGDYLRDTQCLSEKAQVAYDRIMCEHMRNICISKSQLDFFTKKLSVEEKNEVETTLLKIQGGFQIKWVAESIEKRMTYSDSRRKNRKGKNINISKSYDSHMDNEIENVIEDKNIIKGGAGGIEQYFKDLENSQDFETIARTLKIDLDFLKTFIPDFRLKAELKYPNFDRFTSHFKNYVTQQITNATKTGKSDKFSKQKSLEGMEELSRAVLRTDNSGNG